MSEHVQRMNSMVRQQPQILPLGEQWMVRDERGGPFGPSGVSREEAEAWLADLVRVIVVGTLHDHRAVYNQYDDYGGRPCSCGETNIVDWDRHHADMIADRLHAAGIGAAVSGDAEKP